MDSIYILAMSHPTDNVCHTEYVADVMDANPVGILGHHFLHNDVIKALDLHAIQAYTHTLDAIDQHECQVSAANIGYMDP